jgi:endonuclease/exonuclease/phosphatase family metal-dependent hydrolase
MKSFFAKIWGITTSVFNFFLPVLREIASSSVAVLLPIALEIVQSLASTDKTGAEKREAAVKKLTTAAKKQGVSASESLLRFTIESAVQRYKLSL